MAASCAVCHELLSSRDKAYAAKCGHVLHNSCWEIWLKRKSECPECRKRTTKEDLICLFLNQEDSDNLVNFPTNDVDTLSYDIQNLNINRNPGSVKVGQPELIDLADSEDEDSYYSNESEPEVLVEDSEYFESSDLGSEDRSMTGISSESEIDDSLSSDVVSLSGGTGSEDSPSDETGSEGSSDNETESEDAVSDIFLSDGSERDGNGRDGSERDEGVSPEEEESGSYETGSALESDSSVASSDWTTESDN